MNSMDFPVNSGVTTKARCVRKCAPIREDFGYQLAVKKFGQAAVDALPRYVRGPHKGKIKDWIVWYKTTAGGWVKTGQSYEDGQLMGYNGYIAKPGVCFGFMLSSKEEETLEHTPLDKFLQGELRRQAWSKEEVRDVA